MKFRKSKVWPESAYWLTCSVCRTKYDARGHIYSLGEVVRSRCGCDRLPEKRIDYSIDHDGQRIQ